MTGFRRAARGGRAHVSTRPHVGAPTFSEPFSAIRRPVARDGFRGADPMMLAWISNFAEARRRKTRNRSCRSPPPCRDADMRTCGRADTWQRKGFVGSPLWKPKPLSTTTPHVDVSTRGRADPSARRHVGGRTIQGAHTLKHPRVHVRTRGHRGLGRHEGYIDRQPERWGR